jgi:hypothetical protein
MATVTSFVHFIRSSRRNDVVSGYLELIEPIPLIRLLTDEDIKGGFEGSGEGAGEGVGEEASAALLESGCTALCLLLAPSLLLPCDMLRLLAGHLGDIRSIRLLQHRARHGPAEQGPEEQAMQVHGGRHGRYMALIDARSCGAAAAIMTQFHGRPLTSLDPTLALLYGVRRVFEGQETEIGTEAVVEIGAETKAETGTEEGGEICVLCLEGLCGCDDRDRDRDRGRDRGRDIHRDRAESIGGGNSGGGGGGAFSMCCGHTFHLRCAALLQSPACPVCRFRPEDETLSCCQDCGWGGLGPLFEETGRGGAVCAASSSSSNSYNYSNNSSNSSSSSDKNRMDNVHSGMDNDLWLCLVCGFIGCGRSHRGHINAHYEQHMHTYVMNTESRAVFDFAGGGYVHRLLLQQAEQQPAAQPTATAVAARASSFPATTHAAAAPLAAGKLVEAAGNPNPADPAPFSSGTRPTLAELSSEGEEGLVHRELELVAAQYNDILAIQLNRQRQIYETQLRLLDDKFAQAAEGFDANAQAAAGAGAAGSSLTEWMERITASLRAERQRLVQQCENAHLRLKKTEKENSVLEALNHSLVENQSHWRRAVAAAEAELSTAERTLRTELPPLERRLREMMLQLEQGQGQGQGQGGET